MASLTINTAANYSLLTYSELQGIMKNLNTCFFKVQGVYKFLDNELSDHEVTDPHTSPEYESKLARYKKARAEMMVLGAAVDAAKGEMIERIQGIA